MTRTAARGRAVLAVLAATAGAVALAAAPASADSSPVSGCYSGSSCWIELNYYVSYSGSSGGDNPVAVTPPPCIAIPWGGSHDGSEKIIGFYDHTNTAPPSSAPPAPPASTPPASPSGSATTTATATASASGSPSASASDWPSPTAWPSATTQPATPAPSGSPAPAETLAPSLQQIVDKANRLDATNPPPAGEWYQIDANTGDSAADSAKCAALPPYLWVPGGSRLPQLDGLRIPAVTLAEMAYNQLTTARLGPVTLNPKQASDTNLPTSVAVMLQQPVRGRLGYTADDVPYVYASAATPTGQSATVWAKETGFAISPGTTADATVFNEAACSRAHAGGARDREAVLGSNESAAAMAQAGPGASIDCGVTYTAPGRYNLTASVSWTVCWTPGPATTAGPPAAGCEPVPGVAGLAPSVSVPAQVAVREIQSVNKG